jgi:hypothetical protein
MKRQQITVFQQRARHRTRSKVEPETKYWMEGKGREKRDGVSCKKGLGEWTGDGEQEFELEWDGGSEQVEVAVVVVMTVGTAADVLSRPTNVLFSRFAILLQGDLHWFRIMR